MLRRRLEQRRGRHAPTPPRARRPPAWPPRYGGSRRPRTGPGRARTTATPTTVPRPTTRRARRSSRSRALPVRPAASSSRPCAWSTAGSMPGTPRTSRSAETRSTQSRAPVGSRCSSRARVPVTRNGKRFAASRTSCDASYPSSVRATAAGAVPGQQRALGEAPEGRGEALQLPHLLARAARLAQQLAWRRRRGRGPGRRSPARAGR